MRALTQVDFLALWESGQALHPLDQGLLAIHAAFPETQQHDNAADWPIGRRNRALAEMRLACFGPALRGWTSCRQCADNLEFQLDGRVLAESHAPEPGETIVVNGRAFRLPTSRDLARIAAEQDPIGASMLLLERCRLDDDAEPPNRTAPTIGWTEQDLDAIGERIAVADPLAEIMLHFDCPTCGESFEESLDLPTFLWAEIEARAKRLLLDVHSLATAYGWSEAEILSLNPARRQFYLEMVHA
jgi:hypothetical protein